MKIFSKNLLADKTWTLFIAVLVSGLLLRFYNYQDRMVFGPEQAISLIHSGRMITEKFSLLGIENLQRVTSDGHVVFSGAIFSYTLVPLQLLFDFNPLPITFIFGLINIATGIAVYLITKKYFGSLRALTAFTLFMFNAHMIYHSTFIWILNYLPLVGLLTFYILLRDKLTKRDIFAVGLLSGIGISMEYLYIPLAIVFLIICLIKSKKYILGVVMFVIGAAIGNLPMLLFDLRHEMYHINTLWNYFLDVMKGSEGAKLSYYHFLPLWPIIMIFASRYKWMLFVLPLYIYINLSSGLINFTGPVGLPQDLVWQNINMTAKEIAKDSTASKNVAVLVDFDSRGHILRYPVEFIYKSALLGVEEYPQSSTLYVVSEQNYNFDASKVWEVRSLDPYEESIIRPIGDNLALYKLTRNEN